MVFRVFLAGTAPLRVGPVWVGIRLIWGLSNLKGPSFIYIIISDGLI